MVAGGGWTGLVAGSGGAVTALSSPLDRGRGLAWAPAGGAFCHLAVSSLSLLAGAVVAQGQGMQRSEPDLGQATPSHTFYQHRPASQSVSSNYNNNNSQICSPQIEY